MQYNTIALNEKQQFNFGNIHIEEDVQISFLGADKKRNKNLQIQLKTTLDSNFIPIDSTTHFIKVSANPLQDSISNAAKEAFATYQVKKANTKAEDALIITGIKPKDPMPDFIHEFVKPPFDNMDADIIDGLSKDEVNTNFNLLTAIANASPAFNIFTNKETGIQKIMYRGTEPIYFVDEVSEPDFPWYLGTDDVALIKIFKRGLIGIQSSSSFGAAPVIAIYTKRNNNSGKAKNRTSFKITGYKNYRFTWK